MPDLTLPAPAHRVPELDGLRGLAILLVLVGHYTGRYDLALAGVYLFFTLSGYLITGLLTHELDKSGRIRLGRFYARRFLRLAPAYTAWIAVTVAVMAPEMASRDWGEALALLTYTANYHQLWAPGPMEGWSFAVLVRHGWSLSVEEQFYLLWPLGLLLLARRGIALPTLAIVAAVLLAWRSMAPYPYDRRAFETNAGWLALGCTLSLARVTLPAMRRVRWLEWLGRVSYPAYLWHIWGWYVGAKLGGVLVAVPLTLGLASLSYYGLEQRVLAWRDRRLPSH